MNNAPPSAQDSIDSPSSKNAFRIAAFKSTASPIGIAEDSLLRTILDEHVEILNFASSQFLDHAMALRLRTIGAKDLVSMLGWPRQIGSDIARRTSSAMTKLMTKLYRLLTRHQDAHDPASTQLVPRRP